MGQIPSNCVLHIVVLHRTLWSSLGQPWKLNCCCQAAHAAHHSNEEQRALRKAIAKAKHFDVHVLKPTVCSSHVLG